MKLRHFAPMPATAGAAVAIIAAPTALAADNSSQSCATVPGVDTVCSSPGTVQINDSAPVQFGPQYPYWEGGYFGGYGFGTGHDDGHR